MLAQLGRSGAVGIASTRNSDRSWNVSFGCNPLNLAGQVLDPEESPWIDVAARKHVISIHVC